MFLHLITSDIFEFELKMHSNDAHIIYYGNMVSDDKIAIPVECEMKIKVR